MVASKRIAVVLSLASYLLVTTAIHALHDHAAHCGHTELSCAGAAVCHETAGHDAASQDTACQDAAGHDGHSSPTDCEDSCFACRFVAAKSILPAVVLPVERFEAVCQFEPLPLVWAPFAPVECSLCRGPPAAC
jgi:hypothetical protein